MNSRLIILSTILIMSGWISVSTHLHADPITHPAIVDFSAIHAATQSPGVTTAQLATPIIVHLSTMGRDMELLLLPGGLKVAPGLIDPLKLPQFFSGTVAGDDTSWVRINVDNGEVSGYIQAFGQLLKLSRSSTSDTDAQTISEWIVTEPSAAPEPKQLRRPIDAILLPPPVSHALVRESRNRNFELSNRAATPGVASRAIRVGIVVDSKFNEEHNARGLAQALSIMNGVDALFQDQLGLSIIVERTRIYEDADMDPLRVEGRSVEGALMAFREARQADTDLPAELALVHLFTGGKDPDDIIGLGWINSVCRVDGYDVSMSSTFAFSMLLTAHEIAHNLGALHDENPACTDLASPNNIMEQRLSGRTKPLFSQCSLQNMQPTLNAVCVIDIIDMGIALRATPTNNSSQRIIAVQVKNNDAFRPAANVQSRTTFPQNTIISNQSGSCTTDNNMLLCNHGNIDAGSAVSISVLATFSAIQASEESQAVVAEIILPDLADSALTNNRATVVLITADSTADPQPDSDDVPVVAAAKTSTGAIRLFDALALLIFVVAGRCMSTTNCVQRNTWLSVSGHPCSAMVTTARER